MVRHTFWIFIVASLEMHVELNQWKADVLGFRDEMRKAEAAQLQALGKILRILGAEPADNGG